jgi:hypothetical protein
MITDQHLRIVWVECTSCFVAKLVSHPDGKRIKLRLFENRALRTLFDPIWRK